MIFEIDNYATINVDFEEYYYKNTFFVECKYCMTSITLKIIKDDNNLSDKILQENKLKLEKITTYKKNNNDTVWNILGYPGVMFIDWLNSAIIYIEKNENNHINKLLRYAVTDGCNLIINYLSI